LRNKPLQLRQNIVYLLCCILICSCCTQQPQQTSKLKKRDSANRALFLKNNPCPSTGKNYGSCPGYVVDHYVPIKRGGGDHPYNMQWQTVEDAKLKDKWE